METRAAHGTPLRRLPTSLWVDDFPALMTRLDQLRAEGLRDIRGHFAAHPELLYECVGLIPAVRAHPASVAVFGAAAEEELLARSRPGGESGRPGPWQGVGGGCSGSRAEC